jgi:hypothetical protein
VDVEAQELLIERSLVQRGRQRKEKSTKTHQARRIALDEATVAILADIGTAAERVPGRPHQPARRRLRVLRRPWWQHALAA